MGWKANLNSSVAAGEWSDPGKSDNEGLRKHLTSSPDVRAQAAAYFVFSVPLRVMHSEK